MGMYKRYLSIVCVACAVLALMFAACENRIEPPTEQPDGTFLWNGILLVREDIWWRGWGGANVDVDVPENVLTTKEYILAVSFESRGGIYKYGFEEFIQVYLDGSWYTIPKELSQNKEPLTLGDFQNTRIEIDLSAAGELPPGKYRLIETFYDEKFKETTYAIANFWVTKPGGKRPPESETTGKARREDIVLSALSPYEARRVITDKDAWFFIVIENLSGKKYCLDNPRTENNPPVLEKHQNGRWENVGYPHANVGLIDGWTTNYNQFFLYNPLTAGRYRLRVPMYILREPKNNIEIIHEFDVIPHETAPEPKWETSRLGETPYNTENTGITMNLKNAVLDENNLELEITLASDKLYNYGEPYEIEASIGGLWYRVPFSSGGFHRPLYTFDPNNPESSRTSFVHNPVFACGILPSGRYRIVKKFTIPLSLVDGGYAAVEYAAAEFFVEETLGSEDVWIEMMRESYPSP